MANDVSKSWFCVFNNPAEHGYEGEPEEVCNRLRDEWCSGSETRSGAWVYCVSAAGLHHIHMVLEDTVTMRFSAIKASYAKGMHFEPTKGNKKQVEDYINKKGAFEEKGEEIICSVVHGEIKGRQGKRNDLTKIYELISEGLTISEILEIDASFFRYRNLIKEMYFLQVDKNTPIVRPVNVYWHTGETGSGKSFSRVQLAQEIGEDNIYFLTTFGSGAFDNYCGQKVLWIEDYRGEFPFSMFLRLLDVYKCEVPARYSNVKALWSEVHITSVLTPMQAYPDKVNSTDSIKQLLRRITSVIYHYKSDMGYYSMEYSPYETYNNMWQAANKQMQIDKQAALALADLDSWSCSEDLGT
jgi:hypothetical protein